MDNKEKHRVDVASCNTQENTSSGGTFLDRELGDKIIKEEDMYTNFFHALVKTCRSTQISKLRPGVQVEWLDSLLDIHEASILFFKKQLTQASTRRQKSCKLFRPWLLRIKILS